MAEEPAKAEAPANVNVTSALPDDVREAVAASDFKCLGETPALLQNFANANAVSHQHRCNMIAEAAVAKMVESIIAVSPAEGGVDVATLGQLMKGLSLTPPPAG